MYLLKTSTVLMLLVGFYAITFLMTLLIRKRKENVDGFMVSSSAVGFGFSAASMTATWVWAASFYAAASSGYKYGLSGALHYGMWGALMILFIYPFGRRFRAVAPQARTLAEVMHARHGSSSQMILVGSNILGSIISLTANFTAAGALVAILSPLSFAHGVLIAGFGVLAYTIWSGFRASVLTDFAQLVAMILAAAVIIPVIFFKVGGPGMFDAGLLRLDAEQANFFSRKAILEQGAPFFVAVLAYAIGNQTIAQRLFAVREDLIKPTFIMATIGYGSIVIGLGMLGMLALMVGLQPHDGDLNNIIPQMASQYLSPFLIGAFFIMVIGSLSSTADADLCALSAIVMTDVYGHNLARAKPNLKLMLWIGRLTMIGATMLGVIFASFKMDILSLLVFVGALWGAIVFPVIASFYWDRVTNKAFVSAVITAFVLFVIARFNLVPMTGVVAGFFEVVAAIGGAVVIGLMAFGFLGRHIGLAIGVLAALVLIPLMLDFMRDYEVLLASLTAYGASTVVCVVVSLLGNERFDFDLIAERVVAFQRQ